MPAVMRDASYITAHMRDADVEEVMCQVPPETKTHELAYNLLMSGDAFIAYYDNRPVMFFGAHPINICSLNAWAIGTHESPRVLREITRFFITDFLPTKLRQGYVMMEARSHVDHKNAHRWLAATGAKPSGEPFPYGRDGEMFLMWRWLPSDYEATRERYGLDGDNHDPQTNR